MSQDDNIRLAGQLLAGIGQGADPDEVAALCSTDVQIEIAGDVGILPWIGRKTGRAAVAGFIRDQRDLTESLRFSVHGITADNEYAVIFGELASRIRLTDRIIETAFALILNIAGGQIVRFQMLEDSFAVSRAVRGSRGAMPRLITSFGFHSTAAEVASGIDLTDKRIIITGGAAGLGLETARVLAGDGAAITLAARRPAAAGLVAEELRQATGNAAIDVRQLDLSDLRSVRAFVDDWDSPLHVLINNAGIMAVPELERTPQGFELQFGTNYLGHFALTLGLHRFLAAADGARVVSLSSSGHFFSPVIFDDIGFDFVPYTPTGAYGQSKSATALLSVGITRKWADDGILSNALNPGAIATGLQKHTGGLKTPAGRRKTPEQGAATTVLLAASPLLDGTSGRYFEDCNEAEQVARRPTDFTGGYAAYALDFENADRLWALSERLIQRVGR